jgi:hypothetical protein
MAPVVTGHDNCEHLLIAYSVVPLRWGHAPRPKGNRAPVAFVGTSFARSVRGAVCALADVVLLLRDNARYGKTQGVRLETDRPSRIEMGLHWSLCEYVAKLRKGPFYRRSG